MPALLRASTAPSPGDADAGRGEGLCGTRLAVAEAGGVVPGSGVEEQAASTSAAAMFNARPRLSIGRAVYGIRTGRVRVRRCHLRAGAGEIRCGGPAPGLLGRGQPHDRDEAVRSGRITAEAWCERNNAFPGGVTLSTLERFGPNADLPTVGLDPDLVWIPGHVEEPRGMRCGPASGPGHDPARC